VQDGLIAIGPFEFAQDAGGHTPILLPAPLGSSRPDRWNLSLTRRYGDHESLGSLQQIVNMSPQVCHVWLWLVIVAADKMMAIV
jgi:hypothetical protein